MTNTDTCVILSLGLVTPVVTFSLSSIRRYIRATEYLSTNAYICYLLESLYVFYF
jgi:hypothetical protein